MFVVGLRPDFLIGLLTSLFVLDLLGSMNLDGLPGWRARGSLGFDPVPHFAMTRPKPGLLVVVREVGE